MNNFYRFLALGLAPFLIIARGEPIPRAIRDVEATRFEPRAVGSVSAIDPVVVMGSTGTYPRVASVMYQNASNSTTGLIGAYADTINSGNDRIIRVVKSLDNGTTWNITGHVTTVPIRESDTDNPFPLQIVPGGRMILAFRNHDIDASGNYTWFRITVASSDDFGENWRFLSHVNERERDDGEAINYGLWEPYLRLANDGTTIQCYYSSETSPDNQDTLMQYSTDGGWTWSDHIVQVSGQNVTSRDGMSGVAVVEKDTLM